MLKGYKTFIMSTCSFHPIIQTALLSNIDNCIIIFVEQFKTEASLKRVMLLKGDGAGTDHLN